jgi:hypothetical protein
MTTSSESSTSMVQDLPPHLPLFNILKLEVPKELTLVANPVYEDKVPENLHPTLYHKTSNPLGAQYMDRVRVPWYMNRWH